MSGEAHLIVRAGDTLAALPAARIRRVVRGLRLHGLPGGGAEVLGLGEFAGEPLAVLDLAPLLGLPPSSATPPVTVVAWLGSGSERELLGLAVDAALEVTLLEGSAADATAAGPSGRTVRRVDLETLGDPS